MQAGIMQGGMVSALFAAVLALVSTPASAAGPDGPGSGMPSRLSLNVTTTRQTQGKSFGERVNAGLPAAGSAVAQGAALSIVIECGLAACVVTLPDGVGYRADLPRRRVEVLKSNKTADPGAAISDSIGQGASLLGGALPAGSSLSAAVSALGNLAGSGDGAAAASHAATGRKLEGGKEGLATAVRAPGVIDVLDSLADGDYALTLVVEKATSGLKDTLKTNVRAVAPQKVQVVLVFGVEAGVLKARHDTARNSVSNLR